MNRSSEITNLAAPRAPAQRPAFFAPRDPEAGRSVAVLGLARKIIVSGSRDARVAAIAMQQRNRVARRQLLAAGLTPGQVHHLVRTERLFRELTGVYAVGSPAPVPLARETSALLSARAGALLSHATAARLWGMLPADDVGQRVHLVVDNGWLPAGPGLHGHRSRTLEAADRRVRERLPVCSPARVLLDLAAKMANHDLQRAFDEAVLAGIVAAREIEELLGRVGRHLGVPALRELVADAEAGITEAETERRLRELIARTDLPRPRRNFWIAGYRLDCYWPEAMLCIETDGFKFHSSRRRFESDRVRDARLAAVGIEVMRITWRQLENEPLAVVARIAAAYARRVGMLAR